VRDGGGTLIYADLRQAGDTVSLDGDAPFNVLAGNAAAVKLRYRGEPFPVRARPGRDLARFTVGEP
jgi:cytoskeleton protein RodZ